MWLRSLQPRLISAVPFTLAIVACSSEPDIPPWQTLFGYSPDALHTLVIGAFGYPYVPVGIGPDTFWLPFDTGNMVGLTVQADTFARLNLPCSETHTRRDSGGRLVSTGCIAHGVRTNTFGVDSNSTSVYEFTHESLPGLVGPTNIPGTRFTIDYSRRIMAIDAGSTPPIVDGFEALPLVSSPRHPRLILVSGRVEGRDVIIEIDTGKSRTTIDRNLVELLGLEDTGSGVRLGRVELGPRGWSVPSARVVDTSGVSEGLPTKISLGVGSDVLSGFVLTVDYASGLFWIEQPR